MYYRKPILYMVESCQTIFIQQLYQTLAFYKKHSCHSYFLNCVCVCFDKHTFLDSLATKVNAAVKMY